MSFASRGTSDSQGIMVTCPECAAQAKTGKVGGSFHFEPNADTRESIWNVGHFIFLEARVRHCLECRWMDIDCTTLILRRRVRGKYPALSAEPSPTGKCPECRQPVEAGLVLGQFTFWADDEVPRGFWGEVFCSRPSVSAKAEAQRCYDCGWTGVKCSTFVEPRSNPDADVILYDK